MKSEVKADLSVTVKSYFFTSQDDRWPCCLAENTSLTEHIESAVPVG
jgi:hypothetical protein